MKISVGLYYLILGLGLFQIITALQSFLQPVIEINNEKSSLKVQLTSKELIKRKKKWKPRKNEYNSGTLWKYSQSVGPAFKGAVTHPGAYKEKKSYADI